MANLVSATASTRVDQQHGNALLVAGNARQLLAVNKRHGHLQQPKHPSLAVASSRASSNNTNIDRRELLLGAGAAGLSVAGAAGAVPVVPPDLSVCIPAQVDTSKASFTVQCCLPKSSTPPKPYVHPSATPLRIRRPAHLIDEAYIAKYNNAYELMRALPESDPRSFKQQADVHCAFCNGAYYLSGSSTNELQIHFSYLFFPWHRWYLYFHERILGSLINDPTFALPYWNWDDQKTGGNQMPAFFNMKDKYPGLYDQYRNQSHLTPAINTLQLSDNNKNLSNEQIIADNISVMYNSLIKPTTATLFMGTAPLRGSINDTSSGGTLELGPHTAIHVWAGDPNQPVGEDMGNFYSAGRDPLFYSHHSNVDKCWDIWNQLPNRRKDLYSDTDFLNSSFIFYNENADLVKVDVKSCINSEKQLGIKYDRSPGDELFRKLVPQPKGKAKGVVPKGKEKLRKLGPKSEKQAAQKLTKSAETLSAVVDRASGKAEFAKSKDISESEVEEVLVLEDVQVPSDVPSSLVVFINLPDADTTTSLNVAEYVGSYTNVPHAGMKDMPRKSNVRFSISDNIDKLGIDDQDSVTVTVVVKSLSKSSSSSGTGVSIGGFKIIYF